MINLPQPLSLMVILAVVGGVIGGIQTVQQNRKRNSDNGIKNNVVVDGTNILAGVFFAVLVCDAFLTVDRVLWSPFVGMGSGAIGGYFVDTLVMLAPKWFTGIIPKLLDGILSHFGYTKKANDDK